MYKCGSCGALIRKTGANEGECPNCSSINLAEKEMPCPECGKDMGEPTDDLLDQIAWHCNKCNIKVFKRMDI